MKKSTLAFTAMGMVIAFLAVMIGRSHVTADSAQETSDTHTYSAKGIVEQISPDRRTATIRHEDIAGYMKAMTMDFTVKDTNELKGISVNDEITFDLVVQTDADWVQHIELQSHHVGDVTNNTFVFHMPSDELKAGDPLPDGDLVSEYGNHFKLSDFRGRVLALTFFFTSCPLPDYCPRMNRNFAETRQLLSTNSPSDRWELLSISFDPKVDQPQVLSGYATFYRGDNTNHWLFCAAPEPTLAVLAPSLGLSIMRDTSGIAHNLRTVVVGPNGRIFKQFDGNGWSPQDLAEAMRAAAAQN